MNIYQRINEVRKVAAYAKKDKKVEGSGYMAVTHDAVTALLREGMIERGIVAAPNLIASKVADTTTTTAKGIPIIRYEATYDVRFVNVDDPQDMVVTRIEAHALDQGDKAPGKALSYAVKAAMLKLFSIETGEDDEGRAEQYAPNDKKRKPQLPEVGGEASKSVTKSDLDMVRAENPELAEKLSRAATQVSGALLEGKDRVAFEIYTAMRDSLDDVTHKSAFWAFFDSKERRRISGFGQQAKERVE